MVPKSLLLANVSAEIYARVAPLLADPAVPCGSFSQLTETLLFLAQSAYHERKTDGFAKRLLRVKALEIAETQDLTARKKMKRVHVSVDPDARAFLEEFTARYPGLFSSRNEALELIYAHAARSYAEHPTHFAKRLEDTVRLHPRSKR